MGQHKHPQKLIICHAPENWRWTTFWWAAHTPSDLSFFFCKWGRKKNLYCTRKSSTLFLKVSLLTQYYKNSSHIMVTGKNRCSMKSSHLIGRNISKVVQSSKKENFTNDWSLLCLSRASFSWRKITIPNIRLRLLQSLFIFFIVFGIFIVGCLVDLYEENKHVFHRNIEYFLFIVSFIFWKI